MEKNSFEGLKVLAKSVIIVWKGHIVKWYEEEINPIMSICLFNGLVKN